jgi:hypothetical protein
MILLVLLILMMAGLLATHAAVCAYDRVRSRGPRPPCNRPGCQIEGHAGAEDVTHEASPSLGRVSSLSGKWL